ncbi:MAG: OprO/OprP family phosphate-selective porin [Odoribacter splanchnicus]
MKNYILLLILCFIGGGVAVAQTEAQTELEAYMSKGLVYWQSQNKDYSFRVGGRVAMDGAYYIDDFTDRGSGAKFSEARIRLFSKIGKKLDIKFDVDFATSKAVLKDVYLRWHTNANGFVRVGNFAEPFSAENIYSTMDYSFINKSATVEALGTGRALGISYRYYHKYFWGEAGVFSQKIATPTTVGDMGFGVSARVLARLTDDDYNFHIGGAVNYRRPDANGFTNGSDDFNRVVEVHSALESSIDQTNFLNANIKNVKSGFKSGLEAMGNYKNLYVKGEYIHATYDREKDWEYNFINSLGTFMSLYAPTLDAYKKLYGEDTKVKFDGYTVEAGWLIFGGDYQYNRVDALMRRPGGKSLELVARYNHTDLNYIESGSFYYNGGFYAGSMQAAFGMADGSIPGGKVDSFTVGLNYYFTDNIVAKVNYGYQKLDNYYNVDYRLDKNLSSLQVRLAFEF